MENAGLALMVTVLVVGFAGAAARADDFRPAPGLGSLVLDFDTDAGKYSQWKLQDLTGIDAVRTTLQVHRIGMDERWAPGFAIGLENTQATVFFRIISPTREAPFEIHLIRFEGGKTTVDELFKTTLGLDEKLDVAFAWGADGTVTVKLGNGETLNVALGGVASTLQFSGSTGEVEFNPLQIGHAGSLR
jgi:hypothetical protein